MLRLSACFFAAIALHAIFLEFGVSRFSLPVLSISLEPKSVDLRIKTRVIKQEVAPLPPKDKPKEVPSPKPEPLPKKTIPSPIAEQEKLPKQNESVSQKALKQEYISQVQKNARLIDRAEYLSNPPPEYPAQARRRGQQGTVTLLVEVNSKGLVKEVRIWKSSEFLALDRAAEKAVSKWRFNPATSGSTAVSSTVLVPVLFKLNR